MGGEIGTAEMKVIQYNSANTCQNSSCQNYNMKIGYIFRWKKKKKHVMALSITSQTTSTIKFMKAALLLCYGENSPSHKEPSAERNLPMSYSGLN